jgi:acylphosphatase
MTALRVFYEGRVQGVGFRYATKQIAMGFDVAGWVRNLVDGRVEMQVSGEEEEVEAFLREIQESQLGPQIQDERRMVITLDEAFSGFSIRT